MHNEKGNTLYLSPQFHQSWASRLSVCVAPGGGSRVFPALSPRVSVKEHFLPGRDPIWTAGGDSPWGYNTPDETRNGNRLVRRRVNVLHFLRNEWFKCVAIRRLCSASSSRFGLRGLLEQRAEECFQLSHWCMCQEHFKHILYVWKQSYSDSVDLWPCYVLN